MNVLYGIDIGGTTIKTALVSETGDILCKGSLPTEPKLGVQHMAHQLKDQLSRLLTERGVSEAQVVGIGAGVPAFYDADRRVVVNAINLGWVDVPLAELLTDTFGLPVAVDNDANLAALGEAWRGAGQGHHDILCATVGTGIGGGIVIRQHVYRGSKGMAAEIGHLVVQRDGGHPCNCGSAGCLETVASATAIVREAASLKASGLIPASAPVTEAKHVFALAEQGNEHAQQVVAEAGSWLGYGLALATAVLNPDVIVVGGGVSRAGGDWFHHVENAFKRHCVSMLADVVQLRLAALGNDAGVVGAACLIAQQLQANA